MVAVREGEGWSHLKVSSLSGLVVDAGVGSQPDYLHGALPGDLGVLATWWLGSKRTRSTLRHYLL